MTKRRTVLDAQDYDYEEACFNEAYAKACLAAMADDCDRPPQSDASLDALAELAENEGARQ